MSASLSPQVKAEWTYSGKALRLDCMKNVLITLTMLLIPILVGTVLTMVPGFAGTIATAAASAEISQDDLPIKTVEHSPLYGYTMSALWAVTLAVSVGLWAKFTLMFLSRTKTRYLLTAERLEMIRGSDRKSMDLVHIEDLTLEQSAMDKLVNGGVGTVVASASGKGNASKIYVLKLEGVEDPQDVFDTVNRARIDVRKQHGIATVRGVERQTARRSAIGRLNSTNYGKEPLR